MMTARAGDDRGGTGCRGRSVSRPGVPAAVYRGALTLLVLLVTGCTESVEPNLGTERPFTIWGVLNPDVDAQAIRVFEIEPTLKLVRPEPLDATLTSTDLSTGASRVWRDSVVTLADGDYRHVYWSPFRAEHGHRYRIDVVRSDGEAVEAEVTVPMPVTLDILTPSENQSNEILLPILVRGAPPSLPRIDVSYDVASFSRDGTTRYDKFITLSYDGRQTPAAEGWLIPIDLKDDFRTIFFIFADEELPTGRIVLEEMSITIHVGDENWVSPVGFFDPDFLVEPGTLSNVENGFGFVGAGFTRMESWLPPALLQGRAGFYIQGTGG